MQPLSYELEDRDALDASDAAISRELGGLAGDDLNFGSPRRYRLLGWLAALAQIASFTQLPRVMGQIGYKTSHVRRGTSCF